MTRGHTGCADGVQIAYVTMQFPTPSETFACADVRALKAEGLRVTVFSLRGTHRRHEELIQERALGGVGICAAGALGILRGIWEIALNPRLGLNVAVWAARSEYRRPWELLKLVLLLPSSFFVLHKIRQSPPAIVHLFWGHYPSLVGFLVLSSMPSVKVSMFMGAYDLERGLGISRDLLKRVSVVFTHASVNVPELQRLGASPGIIRVVHRGVELDNFPQSALGKTDRIGWLTAARLIESKGVSRVLEEFARARVSSSGLTLVVAGDGPEKAELVEKARGLGVLESVSFVGHVKQEVLFRMMMQADLFLLMSSKPGERLPNVLKEAMLAGAVCVTTATPGIEELIDDGVSGIVLRDANESVVERLSALNALDSAWKARMRQAATERVRARFDLKVAMRRYMEGWGLAYTTTQPVDVRDRLSTPPGVDS